MTKFTEKSLHSYAMAFYYSAMQSFDRRMAEVESELPRLNTMRQEQHRLFLAFDTAYKNSQKNQLSEEEGAHPDFSVAGPCDRHGHTCQRKHCAMHYPKILHTLYKKKGRLDTPCSSDLNPLIFEFSDSADALVTKVS